MDVASAPCRINDFGEPGAGEEVIMRIIRHVSRHARDTCGMEPTRLTRGKSPGRQRGADATRRDEVERW
jgi:hypothetical protein